MKDFVTVVVTFVGVKNLHRLRDRFIMHSNVNAKLI